MATNPNDIPIIPTREQLGLPPIGDVRRDQDVPTLAVPSPGVNSNGQLDWVMNTIARLESRMAASDRRQMEHRPLPRPEPEPHYAVPLSESVHDTQLLQPPFFPAVHANQPPPQPFVPALSPNFSHVPDSTAHYRPTYSTFQHTQPPNHPLPQPFYGPESFGQYRPYQSNFTLRNNILPQNGVYSLFDQPQFSSLPGPRPTSCWYPSADRPPRGHPSTNNIEVSEWIHHVLTAPTQPIGFSKFNTILII